MLDEITEFFTESEVLSNMWFWVFYAALLAGVWFLPSQLGLLDYTLAEKIFYSVVFFIIDYIIISRFTD
jgi:hypothetical protein